MIARTYNNLLVWSAGLFTRKNQANIITKNDNIILNNAYHIIRVIRVNGLYKLLVHYVRTGFFQPNRMRWILRRSEPPGSQKQDNTAQKYLFMVLMDG